MQTNREFRGADDFRSVLKALPGPDLAVRGAAEARNAVLTKPAGSLGRLEDLAVWYAAWRGDPKPVIARPQAIIFAGNHGVTAHGVSAFPAEVTAQMVGNFVHGGAAINQLCRANGIALSVHALELAENSIFNDCLNVARRQIGCMRFCHVPRRCRTPRRYRCQPDEVVAAGRALHSLSTGGGVLEAQRIASEVLRVRPRYDARRYGEPGYARLSLQCAEEITRGADDTSEMGVFHDLFQPQREANLRVRLDEYTPTGMTVGLLFAY